MSFAERKKPLVIATIVVLLGAALYVGFGYLASPAARANELPVVLKCANPACGEVLRTTREVVNNQTTLDPEQLAAPGLKCTKCNQQTQATALVCPNDGEIYLARTAKGTALCPKCGFDKEAADRELLLKR